MKKSASKRNRHTGRTNAYKARILRDGVPFTYRGGRAVYYALGSSVVHA